MPGASRWLDETASGTTMAQASIAATTSKSLRIASPPSESLGGLPGCGADLPFEVHSLHNTNRITPQDFSGPNVHLSLADNGGRHDGGLRASRALDAGGSRAPQGGARLRRASRCRLRPGRLR